MSGYFIQFTFFLFLIFENPSFSSGSGQNAGWDQDTVSRLKAIIQPVYITSRLVTSKPVIDGILNDECWKTGTWAGNYTKTHSGNRNTHPNSS